MASQQSLRVLRNSLVAQKLPVTARAFSTTVVLRGMLADSINANHNELANYYPHVVNAKGHDEQTRFQNQFVWALARESVAKQMIVYPAMKEVLEDGADLSGKYHGQLHKITEKLSRMQSKPVTDEDFLPLFENLWAATKKHFEDEARDVLKLEEQLGADETAKLSRSFERTEMLAPTRGHPSMPTNPPFATAAALLAAPLDKVANIFRKFPKNESPPPGEPLDVDPGSGTAGSNP
ncbi:HHE domain protein [Xylariomycetidae sp. FL0641]|nr:HHE domain protein [Xylariomycetidae sp. FL0641]